MRLLIIDDTPHNLDLLSRMLRASGNTVYSASDGPEALALAHEYRPDLILLDIQMPGMDGYDVCSRLKADAELSRVPIIFISAMADTDGIVKALNMGGVDYVTKPFNVAEVLARVNSHLTLVKQHREIEQLREHDRQQYLALDRMKTEFFNMATHDLKNPLGVIMGYIEILAEIRVHEDDQALMHDSIETIRSAVDKMCLLVAEMLELAKIGTGAGVRPEPVSLAEMVTLSLRGFEYPARQHRLTLTFEPPAEMITVCLDPIAFSRVIDNLLSNAIKYTPSGGSIHVTVTAEADRAVLHVSDTGLGIPAADLDRVFDAFYRVNRAEHRKVEGTGMGLSAVKTIVEQHQGTVSVQSVLGQGSTFSVDLPRMKNSG